MSNINNVKFPSGLINTLMQKIVSRGDNAAVRSSANIEDEARNTHSGEFESVLNVKAKKI